MPENMAPVVRKDGKEIPGGHDWPSLYKPRLDCRRNFTENWNRRNALYFGLPADTHERSILNQGSSDVHDLQKALERVRECFQLLSESLPRQHELRIERLM